MGQIRRRYLRAATPGEAYWVFLVLPRADWLDYERYREFRQRFLRIHCQVVKYLNQDAQHIVGIAVDPRPRELSEDALYMDVREWSDEVNDLGKEFH